MRDLHHLSESLARFVRERDWEKFHSPKNLAMALSVEVAELLEHFQWASEDESMAPPQEKLQEISEEIADVQIYLTMLADKLGVDILAAAEAKLEENRARYLADEVRGSSEKRPRTGSSASEEP